MFALPAYSLRQGDATIRSPRAIMPFAVRRHLVSALLRRSTNLAPGLVGPVLLSLGLFFSAPSQALSQDSTRSQFLARPESAPQEENALGLQKASPAASTGNLHDNPAAQGILGNTVSAGPLAFRVGLSASLEFNDNVRVEPVAKEGILASAGINFDGNLRLSSRQELALVAVVSQRTPLSGPGKSERLFSVAPNSVLRFQVWVRSLRITPFLKYSRQLDPVLSPVVSSTRILDQAAFTKGLQADLPMSSGGLQLIGIHDRRSQKGDVALAQTSWTRSVGIRGIYNATAAHTLSLDAVAARTRYVGGPSSRVRSQSVSISDEWKVAEQKTLTAVYGYGEQRFEVPRTNGDTLRSGSPFMNLAFNHAPRENLRLNWRVGSSTQEGVASNFFRLTEASLTPEYKFAERLNASFSATHQWIRESGPLGERATRLALNLSLSYALAAKSDLRVMYDHILKDSDIKLREYLQNRITLLFNHQF